MRFKAKLAPEHVQLLSNLIGPISKLAPSSSSATAATTTIGGGDADVHSSFLASPPAAARPAEVAATEMAAAGAGPAREYRASPS